MKTGTQLACDLLAASLFTPIYAEMSTWAIEDTISNPAVFGDMIDAISDLQWLERFIL